MNPYDHFIDPDTGAIPLKTISLWIGEEGLTSTKTDTETLLRFVRKRRAAWLKNGTCLSLRHDSPAIQSLAHEMYEELLGKTYLSPLDGVPPERVLLGLSRILISVRTREETPVGPRNRSSLNAKPLGADEELLSPTSPSRITQSAKKPVVGGQKMSNERGLSFQKYYARLLDEVAPELTHQMSHEIFRQDLAESLVSRKEWKKRPGSVVVRFILCNDIYRQFSEAEMNHVVQILKSLANLKDQDPLTQDEEGQLRKKLHAKVRNTGYKLRAQSLLTLKDTENKDSELIKSDEFNRNWQAQLAEWEVQFQWIAGLEQMPNVEPEENSALDSNFQSASRKRGGESPREDMQTKKTKVESLRPRRSIVNYQVPEPGCDSPETSSDELSEVDDFLDIEDETRYSGCSTESSLPRTHVIQLKIPSRCSDRFFGIQTKATGHLTSHCEQQTERPPDPLVARHRSSTAPPVFHTRGPGVFDRMDLAALYTRRPEFPDAQRSMPISLNGGVDNKGVGQDAGDHHLSLATPAGSVLPSLVIKTFIGGDQWTPGISHPASVLECTSSEFFDWIEELYDRTPSSMDFELDVQPRQHLIGLLRCHNKDFERWKGCIREKLDDSVADGNDGRFQIVMRLHW